MKKKTNWTQKLTCIIFLGFLAFFTVANLFAPKKDFSENENRVLAPAPSLSLSSLFSGEFDTNFESWFTDHFVGRDGWIEMKASTKMMMGSIENNTVYFGNNHHLISQFLSANEGILKQNIESIQAFCDTQDITANILFVPTAAYFNQEELPWGAYNVDQDELMNLCADQFASQNFIDIRDALKAEDSTFFLTDHHWNAKGAGIAYQVICQEVLQKQPQPYTFETVSDSFYGTLYSKSGVFWNPPDTIEKIVFDSPVQVQVTYEEGTAVAQTSDSIYQDSRLQEKDKYTYYADGNHSFVDITTSSTSGRTAVIIKDSYAHILLPYLVQEYSHIQVVDLRYYRLAVSDLITDSANTDVYFIYSLDNLCGDTNLVFLK